MIVFLQYHYTGDSFITIPRYNDVILPVPWYIVILGFHCTCRANTVTFQNSFYCGAPRTWNTLPSHLRNIDYSVGHFKRELFNHFLYLTKTVHDVEPPPPPPRVYVSSATLNKDLQSNRKLQLTECDAP